MSKRTDIPDRLIYTCRCGWVDKGHLDSKEYHEGLGAQGLWRQMGEEKGDFEQGGFKGFALFFSEEEGKSFRVLGWRTPPLTDGVHKVFLVKKGLGKSQKESVALGIFLDISYKFETLQADWLHSLVTDSGFSEEDLVSDVIGFYRAIRPELEWQKLCQPVSKEASLKVWDANGPVGAHKNRTLQPNLYACTECRNRKSSFPAEFAEIRRAKEGEWYKELDLSEFSRRSYGMFAL